MTKEAADLLREWLFWWDGGPFIHLPTRTRAYLASLEKPAEESVPDPALWVSVKKVREITEVMRQFKWGMAGKYGDEAAAKLAVKHFWFELEALLPKPRSTDDALAELQTFLAGLSPDETISPSTRKWMMERVKEARVIR